MLPDVTITCREDLTPPPCPPDLPALAAAALAPLREAVRLGRDAAVLTVCHWPQSPWTAMAGAYAVLKAAVDFCYAHPALRTLEVQCAGEECLRACQFQWNMWFAETRG